jgi:hypothetical protein
VKLEIDLNNKAELKRQQAELTRYLEIIEFALSKENHSKTGNGTGELGLADQVDSRAGISEVLVKLETLPRTFLSTDLYALTDTFISRGVAKAALNEQIEKGKLKEIQKGIGRRPTKFQKL